MVERKAHKRDRSLLTDVGGSSTPSFRNGPALKEAYPQRERARRFSINPRAIAVFLAVIVSLSVCGAIGLVVLSNTSAFAILSIDAQPTEHVSAEDIATLANIPSGTTLLNYDEELIVANVKRNPWIGEVKVHRVYPDRLSIEVKERDVRALVMLNAGSVVWCLGNDNVWIEPLKVTAEKGQSMSEAVLTKALSMGALLITDVPNSVDPVAGTPADDPVFTAMSVFYDELSENFWADVVSFSAPSDESISCILSSGVEVSLGSATNIQTKESVVTQLLAKYPNRLTYINVRVPSNPTYRMVESESVQEGTGAVGDMNDPDAPVQKEPEKESADDEDAETKDAETSDDSSGDGEGEYEEGYYDGGYYDGGYYDGGYYDDGGYDGGYYDEGYYDDSGYDGGYYEEGYYDGSYGNVEDC